MRPSVTMMPLLNIQNLSVHFPQKSGHPLKALQDISFAMQPGEILGIAGESGSGKSTLLKSILGLNPVSSGKIEFQGRSIVTLSTKALRSLRHDVQMVFQNPYGSLNPRIRIGQALVEALQVRGSIQKDILKIQLDSLLASVGLDADAAGRFPFAFSGGQRQRIAIARALATRPQLLLADEPTSALDVSVQSQVLNLFLKLRIELGLSMIFVSHSLGALAQVANRIGVLYLGRLVELGETQRVLATPLHPYTQALRAAVLLPNSRLERNRPHSFLIGEPPSLMNPPRGCAFHPRCPYAIDACHQSIPPLAAKGDHSAACIRIPLDNAVI